ncbi:MAG: metallophosphoesterase family protein [Cyclonatronaceae bacterium]
MRIAVLSDIHANLPALEACLTKLDSLDFDHVISLGDQVGYGPFPNEVINILRELKIPTVLGNHDAGAVGRIPLNMFREPNHSLLTWTRDNLTAENRTYLLKAPLTLQEDKWIAAHASPVDPEQWTYLNSAPKCREVLEQVQQTFCLVGHTHVPGVIADRIGVLRVKPGYRYVINPGSIGQPRDSSRMASFGILDTEACTWDHHQVSWQSKETLKGYDRMGFDLETGTRLLFL